MVIAIIHRQSGQFGYSGLADGNKEFDTILVMARSANSAEPRGYLLDGILAMVAVFVTVGAMCFDARGNTLSTVLVALFLLLAPFSLALAWWRLFSQPKRGLRFWISLAGCMVFAFAFAIPIIRGVQFRMHLHLMDVIWLHEAWTGASAASILLGTVAVKGVRFPLMLGSAVWLFFSMVSFA